MKVFLQRLFKFLAYTGAGVVILLAIAVGMFRLFLPRLPEYQEDIKDWASAAIGMQVEFSGMDARWGLSGPELEFYDTQLIRSDTQTRLIAADTVRVSVALTRLLLEGERVIDRGPDALVQEVVYESILHKSRKALHLRVAHSFEKAFTKRLHEFYGILAYHYSRAEDPDKTEEYLIKAGEEALRSSASSEALTYYQQ